MGNGRKNHQNGGHNQSFSNGDNQSSHRHRSRWEDNANGDPSLWVNRNDNESNDNGGNQDGDMVVVILRISWISWSENL